MSSVCSPLLLRTLRGRTHNIALCLWRVYICHACIYMSRAPCLWGVYICHVLYGMSYVIISAKQHAESKVHLLSNLSEFIANESDKEALYRALVVLGTVTRTINCTAPLFPLISLPASPSTSYFTLFWPFCCCVPLCSSSFLSVFLIFLSLSLPPPPSPLLPLFSFVHSCCLFWFWGNLCVGLLTRSANHCRHSHLSRCQYARTRQWS